MKVAIPAFMIATMLLTGCSGWHQVDTGRRSSSDPARRLRVVQSDGATLILHNARVTGDSLVGDERVAADPQTATAEEWARGYRLQRQALPLTAIETVERRRVSVRRTILAVFGGIAGLYVGALAVFLAS